MMTVIPKIYPLKDALLVVKSICEFLKILTTFLVLNESSLILMLIHFYKGLMDVSNAETLRSTHLILMRTVSYLILETYLYEV